MELSQKEIEQLKYYHSVVDEEKLGFTYHEVNELIRKGIKGQNYDKIKKMYVKNKFKTDIIRIPCYVPSPALPNYNFNPIGSLL